MRTALWVLGVLFLFPLLRAKSEPANDITVGLYQMSLKNGNNMSELKLLAEHGLADAQMKVAQACMDNQLFADALKWYSKAADQGVVEARYQKGHMLLFGCHSQAAAQNVEPQQVTGYNFTFSAATNGHYGACYDLAIAHRDGVGCPVDYVVAYAWFSFCADHGNDVSRAALNWLALRISGDEIRQALALARETKQGHWPSSSKTEVSRHTPPVDIRLKLSGIICSPRGNMVVINKHSIAEGETIRFKSDKNELVNVTCVSVQPDVVRVRVADEDELRTLVPNEN
jgi:hypothetical protein